MRTRFEQQGFVPADRHYLLEFDKLPALTKESGLVFLGLGAALIALAVTVWIVKAWKARREPEFEVGAMKMGHGANITATVFIGK